MKDLLKTAAYLSILSQTSQSASNTAALLRIEEDKARERQREIEEEKQSELDDQVLEQVLLDDITRLNNHLESQGIDVSADELVKMYHERLEAVDHKLLSDVRYQDRDGGQLKVMVGADLSEFLTLEIFAFFQEYCAWWGELSRDEKLEENQIVLDKLANSSIPSAREVASRITKISNNQASLFEARGKGKIHASDLEIGLLAAKDSRISSVNSSQLLILESHPKKKIIMSIQFACADLPSQAYGAYSLKAMLVHNSFSERRNELEGKGITCRENSLFQEIDDDFFELGWNASFFEKVNSLHDYISTNKQDVRELRELQRGVEMTIKRSDALQKGTINPDKFLRSSQGKLIAGICKGMEDCYGVSTWISRPLFILSAGCGFGVVAYGIIAIATNRDSEVL